jgi:hypothetical protein
MLVVPWSGKAVKNKNNQTVTLAVAGEFNGCGHHAQTGLGGQFAPAGLNSI